jgi:hypothetical protein
MVGSIGQPCGFLLARMGVRWAMLGGVGWADKIQDMVRYLSKFGLLWLGSSRAVDEDGGRAVLCFLLSKRAGFAACGIGAMLRDRANNHGAL